MAVAPMVNIGIFSYVFRKSTGTNSCRFPIRSIPIRIIMCNISGTDMCGDKYFLISFVIVSIFHLTPELRGAGN